MAEYKFSNRTLNWFRTYLSDRENKVQIGTETSDSLEVGDKGAPQGSVLGGLLFNIYSNDLPSGREGDSTDFVDDHSDQCEDEDIDKLQEKLQIEADRTSKWLKMNGMAISGEKSKLLIMKTNDPPAIEIELDRNILTPTLSERYLGVYLSSNMSWQHHIYGENWRIKDNHPGLINILNSRIGLLRKISKHASREKLLIMVDGIILSKLRYNLGLIGNIWIRNPYKEKEDRKRTFTKKDNHNLQVVMNKALKLAVGKKKNNYPTAELLEETNKLSIHQEVTYQIGVNAVRINKINRPVSLSNLIKQKEGRNTRKKTFEKKVTRLEITRESFSNKAIEVLNLIPKELLAIEKTERFKREFRKWILKEVPIKP